MKQKPFQKIKRLELTHEQVLKLRMFSALKYALDSIPKNKVEKFYADFFNKSSPQRLRSFLNYPPFDFSDDVFISALNRLDGEDTPRGRITFKRTRASIIAYCNIMHLTLTLSVREKIIQKAIQQQQKTREENKRREAYYEKKMMYEVIEDLKKRNHTDDEIKKYIDPKLVDEAIKNNFYVKQPTGENNV